MAAMKFLTPMVLVLGAALPAWAQAPAGSVENFGCRTDLRNINGVPAGFRELWVVFDTEKHCPNPTSNPSIQMTCEGDLGPGWPSNVSINVKGTPCQIDGRQCGIDQVFDAGNTQLKVDPVVINGQTFGHVSLRCSRSTTPGG
jgi:hypothetical protein